MSGVWEGHRGKGHRVGPHHSSCSSLRRTASGCWQHGAALLSAGCRSSRPDCFVRAWPVGLRASPCLWCCGRAPACRGSGANGTRAAAAAARTLVAQARVTPWVALGRAACAPAGLLAPTPVLELLMRTQQMRAQLTGSPRSGARSLPRDRRPSMRADAPCRTTRRAPSAAAPAQCPSHAPSTSSSCSCACSGACYPRSVAWLRSCPAVLPTAGGRRQRCRCHRAGSTHHGAVHHTSAHRHTGGAPPWPQARPPLRERSSSSSSSSSAPATVDLVPRSSIPAGAACRSGCWTWRCSACRSWASAPRRCRPPLGSWVSHLPSWGCCPGAWAARGVGAHTLRVGHGMAAHVHLHSTPCHTHLRRESELVEEFIRRCNRHLALELEQRRQAGALDGLSTRERLALALRMRLSMLEPHMEAWPQVQQWFM